MMMMTIAIAIGGQYGNRRDWRLLLLLPVSPAVHLSITIVAVVASAIILMTTVVMTLILLLTMMMVLILLIMMVLISSRTSGLVILSCLIARSVSLPLLVVLLLVLSGRHRPERTAGGSYAIGADSEPFLLPTSPTPSSSCCVGVGVVMGKALIDMTRS